MNCNTTHYRANSSSVPGDPTDYALAYAQVLRELGALAESRHDRDSARQAYDAACEVVGRLVASHPARLELRDAHALARHALAELALAAGDAATALQEADRGLAEIRIALAKESRQPTRRNHMYYLLRVRGRALLARGDHAGARDTLAELAAYCDHGEELVAAAAVATAAMAQPEAGEHAAWYRARALEWLRAAADKGLTKEWLAGGRFAALRDDPEFVAIARSLGGQ